MLFLNTFFRSIPANNAAESLNTSQGSQTTLGPLKELWLYPRKKGFPAPNAATSLKVKAVSIDTSKLVKVVCTRVILVGNLLQIKEYTSTKDLVKKL